jgi:hypothetical protein
MIPALKCESWGTRQAITKEENLTANFDGLFRAALKVIR